jgi:hypothetical protein
MNVDCRCSQSASAIWVRHKEGAKWVSVGNSSSRNPEVVRGYMRVGVVTDRQSESELEVPVELAGAK